MEKARVIEASRAVLEDGLAGVEEHTIVRRLCERLLAEGVPVARSSAVIDTLHPVFEGRAFRWRRDVTDLDPVIAFGRTSNGNKTTDPWQFSPFFYLLERGETVLRRRLGNGSHGFPILDELAAEGFTDYVAMVSPFPEAGIIGEMDCFYLSYASDDPNGFTDQQVEAMVKLLEPVALAVKCVSVSRIAETLVETYLGRDAGRMVLQGRIERGVADRIGAVLWFSDLRNFTRITDAAAPEQIIPFLNDYAEAAISSIHHHGGDVLKLIGDGILAIFRADDPARAARCALDAEALMRERVAALNAERATAGLPATEIYLGLHVGEVFYGNIGSRERLDFTVVGPAVNEVTRISALCRSVEKEVLVSSAFRGIAGGDDRDGLVSVGRFAMKGVERPQELFTRDPASR